MIFVFAFLKLFCFALHDVEEIVSEIRAMSKMCIFHRHHSCFRKYFQILLKINIGHVYM